MWPISTHVNKPENDDVPLWSHRNWRSSARQAYVASPVTTSPRLLH
jgi:hypothetical protein